MGGRGFRRGLGVALAGVMALSAVPAFAADEAPRLVKVTAPTDEMIHELEESYDVGYLADHTEAAVYVDGRRGGAAARARLHDRGHGRGREHVGSAQGRDRGHQGG